MKLYRIKYLKSIGKFVLHVRRTRRYPGKSPKWGWFREWSIEFHTESMARKYAEGNF